jgi:hypothetical protein
MSDHCDRDNHANQLNPNNDAYWQSRGFDERPGDWHERADGGGSMEPTPAPSKGQPKEGLEHS